MSTVWVPQEPTRLDQEFNVRVPIMDLTPASEYGDIEVLLPSGRSTMDLANIRRALKEKTASSTADDYLVAVGDPALIALCAIVLVNKNGKVKMLKWDKNNRRYHSVEIEA